MLNFEAMFSLTLRVPELFHDVSGRPNHPYDWRIGIFQYSIGLTVAYVGFVGLSTASLSLLSKVSPSSAHSVVLKIGTGVTLFGMLARLFGDMQVVMVALSHKLINTDIVNALVFPLLLVCFVLLHFVSKHFFFLM
jgi:hypothetical protein